MKKGLVIVESPTKVRTLKRYLGGDYEIMASVGHVKDLPPKRLGVDKEKGFKPEYVVIRGKGQVLKKLKNAASKVQDVYLAPDPDREGEAIAWHIAEELKKAKAGNGRRYHRVLFHELTRRAILDALKTPTTLNKNRFESQQARRILDRLVGYELSPLLWEKVRQGLSAGRVQSVAVRLVCDREREIQQFVPEEYWSITAKLKAVEPPPFEAKVVKKSGKKLKIENEEQAREIVEALGDASFKVKDVKRVERKKNPPPPFITSTLQQAAARQLGFSAKKTMMLAQRLYEGIELGKEGPVGLITYMRTDSVRLSQEAIKQARGYIKDSFGKEYLPARPRQYRKGKLTQDAHEAIRPTSVKRTPEALAPYLEPDLLRLYSLIWKRFVACQMAAAKYDQTTVDIEAADYSLRAVGSVLKFEGFLKVYGKEAEMEGEDRILPPLETGETLELMGLEPKQHFTQPPPRYSEASLIKALEEKGIGRPSTYAAILSTIQDKNYVRLEKKRFVPTELGFLVTDLLIAHFPEILDAAFTAEMEQGLDKVEEGAVSWVELLSRFYDTFSKRLDAAKENMESVKQKGVATDVKCDKCGSDMVIRYGRTGEFLACSAYPECKNTKNFKRGPDGSIQIVEEKESVTDFKCPKCGASMIKKRGRYGEFLACSGYPKCKSTLPIPTGVKCPKKGCAGEIVQKSSRRGKVFYGCSNYPECDYAVWDRPVPVKCPACGADFLLEKHTEKGKRTLYCANKKCGYRARPGDIGNEEISKEKFL